MYAEIVALTSAALFGTAAVILKKGFEKITWHVVLGAVIVVAGVVIITAF